MHFIQQHKMELSFNGGVQSESLPALLSYWNSNELLPAIEKVLDELEMNEHTLRFSEIEIDAGPVYGPDWQQQLTQRVADALRKKIRESAVVAIPLEKEESNTDKLDLPKDNEELIRHYLLNGNLPWYALQQNTNIIQRLTEWTKGILKTRDDRFLFLQQNPLALERLLLQLSHPDLLSLLQQLNLARTDKMLPVLLPGLSKILSHPSAALLLAHALVFDALAPAQQPLWKILIKRKFQVPALARFEKLNEALVLDRITIKQWKDEVDELKETLFENGIDQKIKSSGQADAPNQPTSYYIPHAGIILIHPFFPAFCKALGLLTDEQQWIHEQAQQKAVLLLHYIAATQLDIPEYELPLCKLLCGWPMNQPVAGVLDLSDDEKTEIENLLQQVISNWTILKSTSTHGLRQSFLQRSGKLSPEENGWRLQMEQQSFDMLLDHLPWTIGVIKTPWMKDLLYVDWM